MMAVQLTFSALRLADVPAEREWPVTHEVSAKSWINRVPAELAEMTSCLNLCLFYMSVACAEILDLCVTALNDGMNTNDSSDTDISARITPDKSQWEGIGYALTELSRNLPRAEDAFRDVEELFGAVGDGPCGTNKCSESSWHAWAVEASARFSKKATRAFRNDDFAELVAAARDAGIRQEHAIRVRQELYRVWVQFYRGHTHKTLTDLPAEQANEIRAAFCQGERGIKRSRPALGRNLLWLRWKDQEGLSDEKIRDRWNGMEASERQRECATASNRIHSGERGADLVSKGLKSARKYLQTTNRQKP